MTKFTAKQQELLEELIEFTDVGFNIEGDVEGSVLGSVGVVKEKPLPTDKAKENPC